MNTEIELPNDIIFEFCVDMDCYKLESYKQVGDYFYCKTNEGDEILIRSKNESNGVSYKVIKFTGKTLEYQPSAKLVMKDVIEVAENYSVVLEYRTVNNQYMPFVVAVNEGGHNRTAVDIISLLKWINKNLPELVEDVNNGVV